MSVNQALALFDDAILRVASDHCLTVIDRAVRFHPHAARTTPACVEQKY